MSASHPGTALITGASAGLGAEFARQLAARGHDLVLVARRGDRLEKLAAELRARHGIKATVVSADLSCDEGIVPVEEWIKSSGDLTVLVNNAGFGSGGLYYQTDAEKQVAMVHVHVVAVARLTRAALPGMVQRGRGEIINVASVAAFATVPTSAMYGSTKAWMVSFTQAIALELAGTGVRVQALCPGFTRTEFHDTLAYKDFDRSVVPDFLWMPAERVVQTSLAALQGHRVVCIPGGWNKLMVSMLSLPPVAAIAQYYGSRRWRKRNE